MSNYDLFMAILSLAITIAAYGIGPMVFTLHHAKLGSERVYPDELRSVCIVSGVVIHVGFSALCLAFSTSPGGILPAIIWTLIWYQISKSILRNAGQLWLLSKEQEMKWRAKERAQRKEQRRQREQEYQDHILPSEELRRRCPQRKVPDPAPAEPPQTPPDAPPSVPSAQPTVPGSDVPPEPPKTAAQPPVAASPKKLRLIIPLSVLCVALIALSAYLGVSLNASRAETEPLTAEVESLSDRLKTVSSENTKLRDQISDLSDENDDLQSENDELVGYRHDAIFLYNRIGFIVSGSSRYHNYECPIFQAADGYWAHNIEYCEYLGYSQCGLCW